MAGYDLVIANCRVVAVDHVFHGWVAVRDGKIASMGDGSPPRAEEVVDGKGYWLLPGRVDPHIHLGVHYPFDMDVEQTTAAARPSSCPTTERSVPTWRFIQIGSA